MAQTALQQAIKAFEDDKLRLQKQLSVEKDKIVLAMLTMSIDTFSKNILTLQSLIETEKGQIKSAYNNGYENTRCNTWKGEDNEMEKEYILSINGESYYNNTYNK